MQSFRHRCLLFEHRTPGGSGYIPTAKQFEWGGYETWLGSCAFEPHASDKLLDTLLEIVAEVRDER